VNKETATIVVPLLAALIAVTVPALRHEIQSHTQAILSDLDWLWNPDGRHMRELNQAVRIYKDGATAAVVFGGAELAMCYFFMDALAVTLGTHPSLPVIGLMTAAGLALWMYVVPPLLRSAQELAYAFSPVTLRPLRAWLGRGRWLGLGSLLVILMPAVSHLSA